MSGFVIRGLDPAPFAPLYGLGDAELARLGVTRMTVDAKPGFPCRITLEDANPGETVLLLNHEYQPAASPYRGHHAIFVREGASEAACHVEDVPEQLSVRLLSVRAYDADDMMTDADVVLGVGLGREVVRMFADPAVSYIHVHNAKRGCFAARVDRR